ncbi:hypothetical protein TcWFU_009094 [Taenia crassiceps]|uniref:Uncharacterized protein n=1 Tax=Taenia crassiceps TaxID=6207 RepID=A0ABR4Q3Y2_9CEST
MLGGARFHWQQIPHCACLSNLATGIPASSNTTWTSRQDAFVYLKWDFWIRRSKPNSRRSHYGENLQQATGMRARSGIAIALVKSRLNRIGSLTCFCGALTCLEGG